MSQTALLALSNPAGVPAAAVAALLATAGDLRGADGAAHSGQYAGLLTLLGDVAERASSLLAGAVMAQSSEEDLAGLANAERLSAAGARVFAALASRTEQYDRVVAMLWAKLARRLHADVLLVRREYAPSAYAGTNWTASLAGSPIRILPGAEPALTALSLDPLVYATGWDLPSFAEQISRFVVLA